MQACRAAGLASLARMGGQAGRQVCRSAGRAARARGQAGRGRGRLCACAQQATEGTWQPAAQGAGRGAVLLLHRGLEYRVRDGS